LRKKGARASGHAETVRRCISSAEVAVRPVRRDQNTGQADLFVTTAHLSVQADDKLVIDAAGSVIIRLNHGNTEPAGDAPRSQSRNRRPLVRSSKKAHLRKSGKTLTQMLLCSIFQEPPRREATSRPNEKERDRIFLPNSRRNPLKRLDSAKRIQGNPSLFLG
jgi:hypothetical protein